MVETCLVTRFGVSKARCTTHSGHVAPERGVPGQDHAFGRDERRAVLHRGPPQPVLDDALGGCELHPVVDALDLLLGSLDDLGPLAEGWRTQRDTAGYAVLYASDPHDCSKPPRPVAADEIAQKVATSQRYRDMG